MITLNPQNIKTITRSLCVDTLFRQNYSTTQSTDYVYNLIEPLNNTISIKLVAMELPNMWYSYSSHNKSNQFSIHCYNIPNRDENGNIDSTGSSYDASYTLEIPDGNYLAAEFEEIMNNLLINTGGGLAFIRFIISEYNTKSAFRAVNANDVDGINPYLVNSNFRFSLDFRVDNIPMSKTAGWMMGYRLTSYMGSYSDQYTDLIGTVGPYYNWILSESSYGSKVDQYLFLEIDDYQRNCVTDKVISSNGTDYLGNNILARIVVSTGQHTIILDNAYDNIFKKRIYFGPTRLDKFRVRLLDRHGDVVNLNSNDFSFVLEVEQVYSQNRL